MDDGSKRAKVGQWPERRGGRGSERLRMESGVSAECREETVMCRSEGKAARVRGLHAPRRRSRNHVVVSGEAKAPRPRGRGKKADGWARVWSGAWG